MTHSSKATRTFAYTLTIETYSGPYGRLRGHVDTVRSIKQFGSLVICLPSSHERGQLRLTHQEQEAKFDWSKEADKINMRLP